MSSLFVRTIIAYLIVFAVPLLLPVAFFKLVGLGGLRELVTYEARDTPLHKLDPRLKVLYPIAMGILSIILNWDYMLIVFGLTIIPWFWLRPSRAKVRVLLVMLCAATPPGASIRICAGSGAGANNSTTRRTPPSQGWRIISGVLGPGAVSC